MQRQRSNGSGCYAKSSAEKAREWFSREAVTWPYLEPTRREELKRAFTIARAYVCGVPAGQYGTAGHRDLASRAKLLTEMEHELLADKPSFEPVEYIDALLEYWDAVSDEQAASQFISLLSDIFTQALQKR